LYRFYKEKDVNVGGQYAINQLLKYVIYVAAFVISLQYLGINMTLILGGAAALLVGIGLGLQQTFNDFFSGLVLLFERSVAVGDILDVDGHVGVVKRIGLRSSLVETLANITVVVPNSHLVSQSVINWTHFDSKVRFDIPIGVAYGTNAQLVKEILLEVAEQNPYILDKPAPFIRFNAFGESSLDFILFFFSKNYLVIEDIRSDLRFEINKAFLENNISIPFPHRHVIVHNPED
jgi:small-conductance mechanosensitive channel